MGLFFHKRTVPVLLHGIKATLNVQSNSDLSPNKVVITVVKLYACLKPFGFLTNQGSFCLTFF